MAKDIKHVVPVTEAVSNHEKLQYDGEAEPPPDYSADFVTSHEHNDLRRGLKQRHISLIAIAGAIGTGLFLGLGYSLQTAGPLGALLAYATIGLVVCAVQFALGEVAALLPVTGSFVRHAEFLIDPAMGFAIGWNLVYGTWLGIPTEISAICVLVQYWSDVNTSVWIVVSIVLTFCMGIAFVRVYGEVMRAKVTKKKSTDSSQVEFWFSVLKIMLIIFLIILGLVINLGGVPGVPRLGFYYWQNPGPFVEYIDVGAWGNFLGYWACMSSAVFAFGGTESVAMAAAETRNPRQAIPRACKRVFARVFLFYILSIIVVGMLVSSDDERLNEASGTAAQSPFIIAASAAGINAIPSVVNAIVITSAWSSSNQGMLTGTRVLYALALKGQAPKIFLRTTRWGIPYVCVLVQTAFMFLAFMTLSNGALTVFYWLVDLTACGVLINWILILINHQRLILAMRKQNLPLNLLPWHNTWTTISTPLALSLSIVILLTTGFRAFTQGNWSISTFISSYLDIPLVLMGFALWKIIKRTKIVPLDQIPLRQAFEEMEQNPEPIEPVKRGWRRVVGLLWD